MRKILMLVFAPIRKNKGQTINLLVFALLTAMLLNIGLVLLFGIDSFFDERAEASHAPHFYSIYYAGSDSATEGQRFMERDSRIAEVQNIQTIGGFGEFTIDDAKVMMFLILSRVSETQKMDRPAMIGPCLPLTGNRIYVPYDVFLSGSYDIGDDFTMFLSGHEMHFTVAGATEEIMHGSSMGMGYRLYIADEKYSELENMLSDNILTLLSARFHDIEDSVYFQSDYEKSISANGLIIHESYGGMKQTRLLVPTIVAVIIAAFAMVLLGVSLIVIRFRIMNGIEENMANIGIQKAVGYRNTQIIIANVMQYGLVALAGGVIGTILAGVLLPVIAKLFEAQIALVWNPGFEISMAGASVLLVLLTVTLISFLTSRRINRLHPLIALRGGFHTHNFKKNAFPLDTTRGALHFLLALKQIMQSKKQAFTIMIIIAAITMTAVVGISLNYSMNGGRDVFLRSMFDEVAMVDAGFLLKDGDEGERFRERLLAYPEIRKVLAYQASGKILLVDEISTFTYVVEDFSQLESQMLIEGYYPEYDNEIALGLVTLKAIDKKIGDTVTLRTGDSKSEYIVTGIVQSLNSYVLGMLTTDGIQSVLPDFKYTDYLVYMEAGTDVKAIIENIQAKEGDIIETTMNMQDQMDTTFASMGAMFGAAAYGILAVTVIVVVLTLYMIIKTTVLKRKRELGIQKAVGFTTFMLMNQVALNMTPIILMGVLSGTVAGCFGFNPLLAVMLSGVGIAKAELPIPLGQIIAVGFILVVLAYAVSMLIAWRIRKISAYALVSE